MTSSTAAWQLKRDENHQRLQAQIDQHTFAVQRAQRGNLFFGSLLYPVMYQKDLQSIAILKKQQWLGQIDQAEVDAFKTAMPEVASAYNRAFQWVFPAKGAFVGGAAFGLCHLMNVGYSFRMAGLMVPVLYDVVLSKYLASRGQSAEFKSMEFMDWCVQMRQAKGQYELNLPKMDKALMADYQKQCGKMSVSSGMSQLAQL